jgi:4-hydroxybenzoate polyprenyltransferase
MKRRQRRPPAGARLRGAVALLRPRQWIKNSFVLAPLVFAGEFRDPAAIRQALSAAALFCVGSSAAYIVNDILDRESDRRHPVKSRSRPLASGALGVPTAVALLAALYGTLLAAAFQVPRVALVIAAYLALNLAYSFALKHQPVVDIFSIASGFVLRVYAGAVALGVTLSGWMFVTTLSLALYLAAIKRRQELLLTSGRGRSVLARYSLDLVDRYAAMSATAALLFYALYVISTRPAMVATIPIVLFGMFRYWYIVDRHGQGESPTDAVLADWPLQVTLLAWLATTIWALSPGQP